MAAPGGDTPEPSRPAGIRRWLARRIAVVSADRALRELLVASVRTLAEVVVSHDSAAAIAADDPAALYIVDLGGRVDAAALGSRGPVIAIALRASLSDVVTVMQRARSVMAVVSGDALVPAELAALAARVIDPNAYGLASVLAPGTQIQSRVVREPRDIAESIAAVVSAAERIDAPRSHRDRIEQCLDEMLMNAMYDAPVDARGNHVFSGIATRERLTMRTDQAVAVDFAYDGTRFAVAVRDAFGSLARTTVLDHLHKCLHAPDVIDRKAGGAGVGLYLITNAASAVMFHVVPGVATEAVCVFDLSSPQPKLSQFGVIEQRDAGGRAAAVPAHRRWSTAERARRRRRVLAAAMASLIVLGGAIGAWRLFRTPAPARLRITAPAGSSIAIDGRVVGRSTRDALVIGGLSPDRDHRLSVRLDGFEPKLEVVHPESGDNAIAVELQPVATLDLETQPADATVEIDGKRVGSTPLVLTSLAPESNVTITCDKLGYQTAHARAHVPPRGGHAHVALALEPSSDFVHVHLVSNPPGALVLRDGERATADRTYTPADVVVPAEHVQRFTLVMPDHAPLVIDPFTPARGSPPIEKGGDLAPGSN